MSAKGQNRLFPAERAARDDGARRREQGQLPRPHVVEERPAISRQRVMDHGEVFTPPGLVKDMLDLVAAECARVDSRFLEPACGHGNFLVEVLRRRLALVDLRHKPRTQWEPNALLGLACLYGIELLHDNVSDCRNRLQNLFAEHYLARYGKLAKPACIAAAGTIVRTNILQGDALKMTTVGDHVYPAEPLVFTEWSLLPGGKFRCRLYEYYDLSQPPPSALSGLFVAASARLTDEDGKPVYIPRQVADRSPVHYLKLAELEKVR